MSNTSQIPYIDIGRSFNELSQEEANSINEYSYKHDYKRFGYQASVTWEDLEARYRTVILAEAGAGKTEEMQQKCESLRSSGNFAFFIPLESLFDENLTELIVGEKLSEFERWFESQTDYAYFFLDALDELKLRGGKLGLALRKFNKSLGSAVTRTKIVVSCRPCDWVVSDLITFKEILPAPIIIKPKDDEQETSHTDDNAEHKSEERFLRPLRNRSDLNTTGSNLISGEVSEQNAQTEELIIYKLRALFDAEIESFIKRSGLVNADALISEIRNNDFWSFARRPQDIIEMISLWEDKQRLGSLTDLMEGHIRYRLRERSDRPETNRQISEERARIGAERLALALVLNKTRTIKIRDESAGYIDHRGSVDGAELLNDWTLLERKALFTLGIFDPPTLGRLSFHHRDSEDYLGAFRFRRLVEKRIASKNKLFRHLFATTEAGKTVVIPSMRPIAIWLMQWNPDVRKVIIENEPELLFKGGDLERISVEARASALKAIVQGFKNTKARGFTYSDATLRRFSSLDLDDALRDVWQDALGSDFTLNFVLFLIKAGRNVNCCDLVEQVADGSSGHSAQIRILAIQTLILCEKTEVMAKLASEFASTPNAWPTEVAQHVISDLYPQFLNIDELIGVIVAVGSQSGVSTDGFSDSLETIALEIQPDCPEATNLILRFADLIVKNQDRGSAHYRGSSVHAWASPALAILCYRYTQCENVTLDRDFLYAALTALHFRSQNYFGRDHAAALRDWISKVGIPSKELYVIEREFLCDTFDSLRPDTVVRPQGSLLESLNIADASWLKEIARDQKKDQRLRLSALLELVSLFKIVDAIDQEEFDLRQIAQGNDCLAASLDAWLKPAEESDDSEWSSIRRENEELEKQRIQRWVDWRTRLTSDPQSAFSEDQLIGTLRTLIDWMLADCRSRSTYQVWDAGSSIREAFGTEVKNLARKAFLEQWREVEYTPFSERTDKKSGTPYTWLFGLNGILAEADKEDWISALSETDVRKAVRLAQVEINGFPLFLEQLAHVNPKIVSDEIGKELTGQLARAHEVQHLPLLQNLSHASIELKKILTKPLMDFILNRKAPMGGDTEDSPLDYHLSQVLRILSEVELREDKDQLLNACLEKFKSAPLSLTAKNWLASALKISGEEATKSLEEVLEELDEEPSKQLVGYLFGKLFSPFEPVSISCENDKASADVLSRLCVIAFTYVIPSEDDERIADEQIELNSRYNAESARGYLLNSLFKLEDYEGLAQVKELAQNPALESIRDYLSERIREQETERVERDAWTIQEIHVLEQSFERVPYDKDSIFDLMASRIEDLQHDVTHHDFFPRQTFQSIELEEEMQRVLALLLESSSNGIYGIVREDEAADSKKTDIKIMSNVFNTRAVIEVKIADNWGLKDFERALRAQLVGQYLRHENCRVGCLLLTYAGRKCRWKNPDNNKWMKFDDVIKHLKELALVDEEANPDIRIAVMGLNLKDPYLEPAHRSQILPKNKKNQK